MYCTNDKICNVCAGELYGEDMLDIKDWGLLFYKVGKFNAHFSLIA